MPRIHNHTVSLIKDSNKVISCSESDCDLARVGAYFRPKTSRVVYQITKVTPIMAIYDFEVVNTKQLQIKQNTNGRFLKDDILDISYKLYELGGIFEIIKPGTNYHVDEVISPKSGVVYFDVVNGLKYSAEIIVTDVGEQGEVRGIGLKYSGKYIECPPNESEFVGQDGEGAVFRCEFSLLSEREILERTVTIVDNQDKITNLFVNYNMPIGLKNGKLSCKKIEITLDRPYEGQTDNSAEYEILNDFTANYKLPLLSPNGVNSQLAINQAFTMIDAKLKELEEKINTK